MNPHLYLMDMERFMPLQAYIKQLRPRTESYTPTVDRIQSILVESSKSDRYEKDVADTLNKIKDVTAERPKVSTAYADIRVTAQNGNTSWIEVKMNHTDNLGNPRVFLMVKSGILHTPHHLHINLWNY